MKPRDELVAATAAMQEAVTLLRQLQDGRADNVIPFRETGTGGGK